MFQLANTKTPRYHVRISMNLTIHYGRNHERLCTRKNQMAQLERLELKLTTKRIFYREDEFTKSGEKQLHKTR